MSNEEKHWAIDLKEKYSDLKRFISIQSIGNYIMLNCNEDEQNEILKHLQDSTKQIIISITAKDKE